MVFIERHHRDALCMTSPTLQNPHTKCVVIRAAYRLYGNHKVAVRQHAGCKSSILAGVISTAYLDLQFCFKFKSEE